MTRKEGYRYKAIVNDLDNKDSHSIPFLTPMPLDYDDIENLLLGVCEVRINDILEGKKGYNYPPVSQNLCNVSCKGSYLYNGVPYTTEKMYFKYVKLSLANQESFLPYMKALYGSSFEFVAFRATLK